MVKGRVKDKGGPLVVLTVRKDNLRAQTQYKSIDMDARSHRNNLIFKGHPENLKSDDRDHLVQSYKT